MVCPKCSKEIPDGSKFCPECGFTIWAVQPEPAAGAPQTAEPSQTPYVAAPPSAAGAEGDPKQGNSKAILIIGIIMALIAVAAAVIILFVEPGYLIPIKQAEPAETVVAPTPTPAPVVEAPKEETVEAEPVEESEEPVEESDEKSEEEEETSLDIKEISVYDEADLLNSTEEKALSEKIKQYEEETGWKFLFVSAEGIRKDGTESYAEDRYDDIYGSETSGIIVLIDLDNRMIWLSSFREPERYLSGEAIDEILTSVEEDLGNEKYAEAVTQIISECAELKTNAGADE